MKDFINDKPAIDIINEIMQSASPISNADVDELLEKAEQSIRGRTISYDDNYLAGLITGINLAENI